MCIRDRCLDFVMNHTASTHRWAMAAKAGDAAYQAYYHCYDDRTIPDQYAVSYTHLDVYKRQP